jgi:hypothetical protein
MIDGVHQVAKH